MRYVPWGAELDGLPHIVVFGHGRDDSALALSNWPGSSTPAEIIADTALETALAALRSPACRSVIDGAAAVSCAEFHAGALLALWATLNPDAALARTAQLTRFARAAEFGVTDGMESIAFVCTIDAYADPAESPLGPALAALPAADRTAALYNALLPQVGALLDTIRDFDLIWIGGYSDVLQAEALLNSGAVQLESVPELDLVLLDTPLRLHPLVALTVSAGRSRLLTVRSENTYSLEYRRESWVQYRGYRPLPRINLSGLATRLNMFELKPGHWRADPLDAPRSALYFDDGRGAPSPSSIDRETVVAEMTDYLRRHARDRALQWSPYPGGH